MSNIERGYGVESFNIKDSKGQFTYKVKLSDHVSLDPKTGFLYCDKAIVGNVGIQVYSGSELGFADGNATVKVHRVKEYIFASDSLDSLKGKPITFDHPSEMVDSNNVRELGMGTILNVGEVDGDNIVCDLVIQNQELIDAMTFYDEDGKLCINEDYRDLSLGYSANLKPYKDSGEYVQTDIEYNHLAVVREGRAENAMIVDSKNSKTKEKKSMKLFDWLVGKKVKPNEDGSITILDSEEVVAKRETVTKEEYKNYEGEVIKEETKVTSVTKKDSEDGAEIEEEIKDKKNEGVNEIMKDKEYFDKAFKDAMGLPEGPFREDKIKSLNDEYLELFPREITDAKTNITDSEPSVLEGIKPVNSEEIHKDFTDQKSEFVDFQKMEKESKLYYDKLSNPESSQHESHKAWKDFYNSEVRSGKVNLNL